MIELVEILRRQRDARRGGDGAVDAGEAAVRVHRDPLARRHLVELPDKPGRPEHEPVVRPARSPHRLDQQPPGHRLPLLGQRGASERGTLGERLRLGTGPDRIILLEQLP